MVQLRRELEETAARAEATRVSAEETVSLTSGPWSLVRDP